MCMGSPDIPKTPAPQAATTPDSTSMARAQRQRASMAGASGTLLTGPSGVENAAVNKGATTLLGG